MLNWNNPSDGWQQYSQSTGKPQHKARAVNLLWWRRIGFLWKQRERRCCFRCSSHRWQMSAERLFDKPVLGSACSRRRQWSIHWPALVYGPVSLILSSTGACLKTQVTLDSILNAAMLSVGKLLKCVKAWRLCESCSQEVDDGGDVRPPLEGTDFYLLQAGNQGTREQLLVSWISNRKHFCMKSPIMEICVFIQGHFQDPHQHFLLQKSQMPFVSQ